MSKNIPSICRYFFLSGLLISFSACKDKLPPQVFVTASNYRQHVVASAEPNQVSVGQTVLLRAARKSGPFVQVESKTLSARTPWWKSEPPTDEPEVADNLQWEVSPSGFAKFNSDFRADHIREITFSQPGKYILKGFSSSWDGSRTVSNELEINVVQPH